MSILSPFKEALWPKPYCLVETGLIITLFTSLCYKRKKKKFVKNRTLILCYDFECLSFILFFGVNRNDATFFHERFKRGNTLLVILSVSAMKGQAFIVFSVLLLSGANKKNLSCIKSWCPWDPEVIWVSTFSDQVVKKLLTKCSLPGLQTATTVASETIFGGLRELNLHLEEFVRKHDHQNSHLFWWSCNLFIY